MALHGVEDTGEGNGVAFVIHYSNSKSSEEFMNAGFRSK
jgi:hypothetical protein